MKKIFGIIAIMLFGLIGYSQVNVYPSGKAPYYQTNIRVKDTSGVDGILLADSITGQDGNITVYLKGNLSLRDTLLFYDVTGGVHDTAYIWQDDVGGNLYIYSTDNILIGKTGSSDEVQILQAFVANVVSNFLGNATFEDAIYSEDTLFIGTSGSTVGYIYKSGNDLVLDNGNEQIYISPTEIFLNSSGRIVMTGATDVNINAIADDIIIVAGDDITVSASSGLFDVSSDTSSIDADKGVNIDGVTNDNGTLTANILKVVGITEEVLPDSLFSLKDGQAYSVSVQSIGDITLEKMSIDSLYVNDTARFNGGVLFNGDTVYYGTKATIEVSTGDIATEGNMTVDSIKSISLKRTVKTMAYVSDSSLHNADSLVFVNDTNIQDAIDSAASLGWHVGIMAGEYTLTVGEIILKDGVNISGIGGVAKINFTDAGAGIDGMVDNGVEMDCNLSNLYIYKSGSARWALLLTDAGSDIFCSNVTFHSAGSGAYVGGKLEGGYKCITDGSGTNGLLAPIGATVKNFNSNSSTGGIALKNQGDAMMGTTSSNTSTSLLTDGSGRSWGTSSYSLANRSVNYGINIGTFHISDGSNGYMSYDTSKTMLVGAYNGSGATGAAMSIGNAVDNGYRSYAALSVGWSDATTGFTLGENSVAAMSFGSVGDNGIVGFDNAGGIAVGCGGNAFSAAGASMRAQTSNDIPARMYMGMSYSLLPLYTLAMKGDSIQILGGIYANERDNAGAFPIVIDPAVAHHSQNIAGAFLYTKFGSSCISTTAGGINAVIDNIISNKPVGNVTDTADVWIMRNLACDVVRSCTVDTIASFPTIHIIKDVTGHDSLSNNIVITGTSDIDSIAASSLIPNYTVLYIYFTGTAGSNGMVNGKNISLNPFYGDLKYVPGDMITLQRLGDTFNELSRKSASDILINNITEYTADHGVVLETVLLKDDSVFAAHFGGHSDFSIGLAGEDVTFFNDTIKINDGATNSGNIMPAGTKITIAGNQAAKDYFTIDVDEIVINSDGGDIEIVAGVDVTIEGSDDVSIESVDDVEIVAGDDFDFQASGSMTIEVTGTIDFIVDTFEVSGNIKGDTSFFAVHGRDDLDYNIEGDNFTATIADTYIVDAAEISLKSSTDMDIDIDDELTITADEGIVVGSNMQIEDTVALIDGSDTTIFMDNATGDITMDGTLTMDSLKTIAECSSIADDGTINLPDATAGKVEIWVSDGILDEYILARVYNDGSVTLITTNGATSAIDADGFLCLYDGGGTQAIIKNTLGARYTVCYEFKQAQ